MGKEYEQMFLLRLATIVAHSIPIEVRQVDSADEGEAEADNKETDEVNSSLLQFTNHEHLI